MDGNFFRRLIVSGLIFGSLIGTPSVDADTHSYKAVGESQLSEAESIEIVKLRAKENAIELALEQVGVYLQSYSRTQNFDLTDDEIEAITSTRYELLGEPRYRRLVRQLTDVTTVVVWTAEVRVEVDDDELRSWLALDSTERAALLARSRDAKLTALENKQRVEQLRQRYAAASTDAERDQIRAEFLDADRLLFAAQKLNEGDDFCDDTEYERAVECFTEAIELNPNYVEAYYKRGIVYHMEFDDRTRALADFNRAIELQPNYDEAYYERGCVYLFGESTVADQSRAIADFDKAIALTPKYANAYRMRGLSYSYLKDYARAIEDYNRSLELHPKDAWAYRLRGEAYQKLGDEARAQADFARSDALRH